ncbi:MAG: hypothetical protein PHI80_02595 [Candidatus Dojkabacteria bacterium]|nr:hypothetical protein [Candidatus Dojkabacteria bacterium]
MIQSIRVGIKTVLPFSTSLFLNEILLSSSLIFSLNTFNISPSSSPSDINIMVIPVSFSPSNIAFWIGTAPLYLGSMEKCILIQPYLG